MDDKEKFVVRISCEPKVEPIDIGGAKIVDKIFTARVEKVNESIISQLRDLMKEKGINELYAIDESKVLQLIDEHEALKIIKNIGILKPYETIGGQCWLETMCDATKITKDNYNILKEAGL